MTSPSDNPQRTFADRAACVIAGVIAVFAAVNGLFALVCGYMMAAGYVERLGGKGALLDITWHGNAMVVSAADAHPCRGCGGTGREATDA